MDSTTTIASRNSNNLYIENITKHNNPHKKCKLAHLFPGSKERGQELGHMRGYSWELLLSIHMTAMVIHSEIIQNYIMKNI